MIKSVDQNRQTWQRWFMRYQLTVLRYWVGAHRALGQPPTFELLEVFRRYREAHRRYHTLGHIAACLRMLENYRHRLSKLDFAMLVLAVIYHDLIYDVAPGAKNEGHSAQKWTYYALYRFNSHVIDTVSRLILLTAKHTFEPCGEVLDRLGPIMIDVDMHVLALPWHGPKGKRTPWNSYIEYARAVRREFSCYPLPEYVAGRRQFLSTVNPKTTFYTPEMEGAWEAVEENVQRERIALMAAPEFFGEAA